MEFEYSQESFETLEKFVNDTGGIAEAVVTLGNTYLNCEKYSLAQKKFQEVIESSNIDGNPIVSLVAKYGLVLIDFETKKINEDECKKKTEEIGKEIKEQTSKINTQIQCNCQDEFGRSGTQRFNRCIAPCP